MVVALVHHWNIFICMIVSPFETEAFRADGRKGQFLFYYMRGVGKS